MEARSLAEVLEETRSPDPATRKRAVRLLCPCELKLNDTEVWNRILDLTRDPDVGVRKSAVHTLIDGSPRDRAPEIVATIEAMHDDPDPRLRRHVRRILAHHRRTGRLNVNGHP